MAGGWPPLAHRVADKTIGMSSIGSAEPNNMEPGTYRLWTERNALIKMKKCLDQNEERQGFYGNV
jgi:hypothetical protein